MKNTASCFRGTSWGCQGNAPVAIVDPCATVRPHRLAPSPDERLPVIRIGTAGRGDQQ
jgi:hypothetical protein